MVEEEEEEVGVGGPHSGGLLAAVIVWRHTEEVKVGGRKHRGYTGCFSKHHTPNHQQQQQPPKQEIAALIRHVAACTLMTSAGGHCPEPSLSCDYTTQSLILLVHIQYLYICMYTCVIDRWIDKVKITS